jgi:hypothetical protein
MSRQLCTSQNPPAATAAKLRTALDSDVKPAEPANAADFKRIATEHAFGDAWPRTEHLDRRTRALISVTIAATLGIHEPLRGQLRTRLPSPPQQQSSPPSSRQLCDQRPPSPAIAAATGTNSPPECVSFSPNRCCGLWSS